MIITREEFTELLRECSTSTQPIEGHRVAVMEHYGTDGQLIATATYARPSGSGRCVVTYRDCRKGDD